MENRFDLPLELWQEVLSHQVGRGLLAMRSVSKQFAKLAVQALFKQTDEDSVRLQARFLCQPDRASLLADIPDGLILRAMQQSGFDVADRINGLLFIAERKKLGWVIEDSLVDSLINEFASRYRRADLTRAFFKLVQALLPLFNETQFDKMLEWLRVNYIKKSMSGKDFISNEHLEIFSALLPYLSLAQLEREFCAESGKLLFENDKHLALRKLRFFPPHLNNEQHTRMYEVVKNSTPSVSLSPLSLRPVLFSTGTDTLIYSLDMCILLSSLDALSSLSDYLNEHQADEVIYIARSWLRSFKQLVTSYPSLAGNYLTLQTSAVHLLLSLRSHLDYKISARAMNLISFIANSSNVLSLIKDNWHKLGAQKPASLFDLFLDKLKHTGNEKDEVEKIFIFIWSSLTEQQQDKTLEILCTANDFYLSMLSYLWSDLKETQQQTVLKSISENFERLNTDQQCRVLATFPGISDYSKRCNTILSEARNLFASGTNPSPCLKLSLQLFSILKDEKQRAEVLTFMQKIYEQDLHSLRSVTPLLPSAWSSLDDDWRERMLLALEDTLKAGYDSIKVEAYKTLTLLWPQLNDIQRAPFLVQAKTGLNFHDTKLAALNLLSLEVVRSSDASQVLPASTQTDGSLAVSLLNHLVNWHTAVKETIASSQRRTPNPFVQFQPAPATDSHQSAPEQHSATIGMDRM